ncbi:MAG TPA: OB-fold domain-containing protein [Methylomirabilota bacterium]|nr:OB-fold domain-containing protein [Methylomirabilota bacterium]
MVSQILAGYGEIWTFTTLHSPPQGFASPLHIALVTLPGGVNLICHGAETRQLKIGGRVAIEEVDGIYYFSYLGLADRARLFWRRAGARGSKVTSIMKSVVKRLLSERGIDEEPPTR